MVLIVTLDGDGGGYGDLYLCTGDGFSYITEYGSSEGTGTGDGLCGSGDGDGRGDADMNDLHYFNAWKYQKHL